MKVAERPPGQADWTATPVPPEIRDSGAPEIRTDEVPACPVCGSAVFERIAVGFDYELITCTNPWRFVRCGSCGHVWLNPRPAVSELSVIYPPTYYAYNYDEEINGLAVRGKQALDSLKFGKILKALPRSARSYLDVGCGDGRFLRLMEERGVRRDACYGIELDERVVKPLADAGYPAFCTRVEDCDEIPAGALDLVTMFHVIEHVDDPAAVVRRIGEWLAPGGVFAVETPNFDSVDQRLFSDGHWGGYHIPRHWNLFTPDTLRRLLEDAGLEVLSIRYQTGHAFWMYSLHHRLRYGRRPHPRLARMFNPFKGIAPLVGFTAFDKARGAVGFRTSAMLMLARKTGS